MPRPDKHSNACAGGWATQFRQLFLMLYKNFLVLSRQWFSNILVMIWPIAVSVIIWAAFFAGAAPPGSNFVRYSSSFPKCTNPNCITMMYGPNSARAYNIMSTFAQLNGLTIASDPSDLSMSYDVVGFASRRDIDTYLSTLETFSTFWAGVDFSNITYPFTTSPSYTILTGQLRSGLFPITSGSASMEQVQLAMDRAIIRLDSGSDFTFEMTGEPEEVYRNPNITIPDYYDQSITARQSLVVGFGLTPLIILAIWVHVGSVISQLNRDRETQIRLGLRMMGLQAFPYLFGNFILHAFIAVITSLIITAGGHIAQIPWFTKSPFLLVWIVLWLTSCASISFATWLGTWIHRPALNNALMIFFFLACGGMAAVAGFSFFYPAFWGSRGSAATCAFFFPFNLGAIVFHIGERTLVGGAFDVGRNGTVPGFTWSDLYDARTSPIPSRDTSADSIALAPVHFIAFLIGDIILGLWFAWYFDTVWPGDTGVPESFFFFFKPSFWGLAKASPMVATNTFDESRINNVMTDLDPDVNKEHEDALKAVNDQSSENPAVIKVIKLCKTFQTGRIGNRKDHRALDFVSFVCKRGTVTGVLGHNGSGKTTTINLLTGVFRASFGDAFIGPYSIQENIQAIRRIIGVCPQKDILWDTMTAREHLKLFCLLKAIPWSEHEETIMEALKNVRLETKADKRVGTFSGGMKRRLSVAIASIGDPVAIFLDEPSAGLDPANRREIWKVIERLKQNRAIVLTTHSMEEADMISDKIVIYAVGRVRAVGDSLHLKQRFGAGYHLSLNTDDSRAEELKKHVGSFLPEAHLDAENAGQFSYSLPRVRVQQLTKFFKWLESVSAKRGPQGELLPESASALVKDFGLSQTTLEEVFIRLTHGDAILRQMMLGNTSGGGNGAAEIEEVHGDRALRQMQLNVALDGGDEAIGFVNVDVETDLATVRRLINTELSNSPSNFSFMSQGIPIDSSQESRMYAVEFLPMIVIRGEAGSSSTKKRSKGKGKLLIELDSSSAESKEIDVLKNELKSLQNQLRSTLSEFEQAKEQWRQRERDLLAKIAELELKNAPNTERALQRGLSDLRLPETFQFSIPPPASGAMPPQGQLALPSNDDSQQESSKNYESSQEESLEGSNDSRYSSSD